MRPVLPDALREVPLDGTMTAWEADLPNVAGTVDGRVAAACGLAAGKGASTSHGQSGARRRLRGLGPRSACVRDAVR